MVEADDRCKCHRRFQARLLCVYTKKINSYISVHYNHEARQKVDYKKDHYKELLQGQNFPLLSAVSRGKTYSLIHFTKCFHLILLVVQLAGGIIVDSKRNPENNLSFLFKRFSVLYLTTKP